jgi:hypothetical protein
MRHVVVVAHDLDRGRDPGHGEILVIIGSERDRM